MKTKIFSTLVVLILIVSGFSNAQELRFVDDSGMKFETGTWEQVLKTAKENKKPIFIDAYAEWCAPRASGCQQMYSQLLR